MEQQSMTALVSAFSRWYHAKHNEVKIFDDTLAGTLLTEDEKEQISAAMSKGIGFFNPEFSGSKEEALRWIVDNQLSPSPLGRAAWAEKALQAAVSAGTKQYLMVAAGYDTFACRKPPWAKELQVIELDLPAMSADKQQRVQTLCGERAKGEKVHYLPIDLSQDSLSETLRGCEAFDETSLSFCSLLGISYYLSKEHFRTLICEIALVSPKGSTLALDYPDELTSTQAAGERAAKQTLLAQEAQEAMLAGYCSTEMEQLLFDCGYLIREHLAPAEITQQFFEAYNKAYPEHTIAAFDNVNYCLAVKQ